MRLDVFLCDQGYASSRTEAKGYIVAGAVIVSGRVITKPSFDVTEGAEITVDRSSKKYVSRGGLKLEGALDGFGISAEGALALDVGASSGGFTDCLLQRGAAHVVAVDSGSGQLVDSVRYDKRVTVFENYNARYMSRDDFNYEPELVVMDVSFISATLIMPAVFSCMKNDGDFICLVKPQFEVGRGGIGKGGIVKDEKRRREALDNVISFAATLGFEFINKMTSPIEGGDGNIEYLVHFKKR